MPREDQQKVLLFGIVFSLIARTGFIFLGAALINQFAWVFYLFGLILMMTAGNMLKPEGEESHSADNAIIRLARKLFHTTPHSTATSCSPHRGQARHDSDAVGDGRHRRHRRALRARLDPGDLRADPEHFIVFTATAFSLLGLRQLFFLIDGLLDRLSISRTGWPRSSGSSASSSSCMRCTRTPSRSSTMASPSRLSRSAPGSP